MKIHVAVRIFLFMTQFVLILYKAQGREIPNGSPKEDGAITDGTMLDDHFWIYAKQIKDEHDQKLDDHFWVYANQPKDTKHSSKELGDHFWIYANKLPKATKHSGHRGLDPKLNIFFTPRDLEAGKTMPVYFSNKKNPSESAQLLSREEADSIPFSSSKLPSLLDYFSISAESGQGRAMKDTLEQCDLEAVKGEVKFCATSRESMLESVNWIFGPGMDRRVLATTYLSMSMASSLQNYTILETPKQVDASKMIGCHPMPYPYAVFYCHSQLGSRQNKLFQVPLAAENGDRVDAVAVCHMDTSMWDPHHVAFRVLSVRPGSSPVCHFFPVDSFIWIPIPSNNQAY